LQLLVETDVETGLRWGELIELRKKDIDFDTGVITVSRVAGELAGKFNPDGQRFFVKQYPKDTEWRAVTLSEHMFGQLAKHTRGCPRVCGSVDWKFRGAPEYRLQRVANCFACSRVGDQTVGPDHLAADGDVATCGGNDLGLDVAQDGGQC